MKGINTSTAVPDMYGPGGAGFRDGDPLSGTPATRLNAEWFNSVQQEILNAIEDAGLTPDQNNLTQLAEAMRSRVGKHVGEIFFYEGRSAPFGAVVADGGLVQREMYPDLWKFVQEQNLVITESAWQTQSTSHRAVGMYSSGDGTTTFRLPVLTDFLRGTADPAKVGTWQGDAIRNITGRVDTTAGLADAAGVFKTAKVTGHYPGTSIFTYDDVFDFDASRVVPTADENRPKTLFLLPCIHAYNAVIPDAQADMHAMMAALNGKVDKTTYAEDFAHAHGASGWQRFANGLIMQWGSATSSASGAVTVTYPVTFPSAFHIFTPSPAATGACMVTSQNENRSSAQVNVWSTSGAQIVMGFHWIALGK